MEYATWSKNKLKRVALKNDRHTTSVWCSEQSDLPLIVLVHGIAGDHAGLAALAQELAKTYQVAIVDLPGHGKSGLTPLPDAAALQQWFADTVNAIEHEIGKIDAICAHSFGCSAVLGKKMLEKRKIILLNPVPTPSVFYEQYARSIMDSTYFWAHIYNWKPFVLMRGLVLAKIRTRDALRRVRWAGLNSRATYRQVIFQSKLVNIILDSSAYKYAKTRKVALVVCGMSDTTAHERDSLDMEDAFGGAKVVFLKGGHLLPIESPDRVAALICETMVN